MNVLLTVCICLLALGHTDAQGKSRAALRKALGQNPLFSHGREVIVPQNVNIVRKIDKNGQSGIVQQELSPKNEPLKVPQMAPSNNEPGKAEGMVQIQDNVNTQMQSGRPIMAGKPDGQEITVLGERAPQIPKESVVSQIRPQASVNRQVTQSPVIQKKMPARVVTQQTINDRMADRRIAKTTAVPSIGLRKIKCMFNMPTFILPDLDITQRDFEQQYLLPALRAHFLQGRTCRTRALTIFIDWLLYLRQKLFNV